MTLLIFITGFIALCSTFASFFFDNKKTILLIQSITLIFFGSHLFLLGSLAGAWFLFIQIVRNLFFSFTKDKRVLLIGLFSLFATYSFIYMNSKQDDNLALLPFVATIFGTLGCYANNTTLVRLFFLLSTIPFTYYTFQSDSFFAITIQLVFTSSILINIIRFNILPLNKKQ